MLKHLAWLACGVPMAGLVRGLRARTGPLPVEGPGVLIKADQNLEKGTAERGVEGWIEHFPEDSKMLPAGKETISGKRAIREAVAPLFATLELSLRWKSASGGISTSRDLGYTYRTFVYKPSTAEGQPVTRYGKYVTIWRKQPDGSWKVVVDIGNPSPPPPSPSKRKVLPGPRNRLFPDTTPESCGLWALHSSAFMLGSPRR